MKKYLLVLICLFFIVTRLYKIGEIPSSVYWDEASIGYNAYSILLTGKDEWGKFLPIHFRAFGEFKLPVYIYAIVPFVKIFDLNAFSIRLPAVFFSLGVVVLTYLLGRKFTGSNAVGLWSSFFISISPWFFIFSRTGFEAIAGLMFYLLGIYLLLINKNYFFLSVLSMIVSAYSYNSFRIIIPLTILLLFFGLKNARQITKWTILSVIVILVSFIPIYRLYVYDAGITRLQNIGTVSGLNIAKNYLSHFNPEFLFISGDNNLRHQQSGFGQLYLPEIILLIAGLMYLSKNNTNYRWIIGFILLGPIPAAVTRESPHALRSLSMVPFIHIISAIGAFYLQKILKKKVIFIILVIYLSFFVNYFFKFLTVYPLQAAKQWQYEYKKIYEDFGQEFDQYNRIDISDKYAQPYIFALFYLKYDPQKFQQEAVRNSINDWGFSTVKKFGKFEFGKFLELFTFEK